MDSTNRVKRAIAAMALTLAAAHAVAETGWPQWGRDAGRTHATPVALPEPLHLQWVRELPTPRRAWPAQRDDFDKLEFDRSYAPVAMDGLLFVPSMVADGVTAYRLDSGATVWRVMVDGPVRLAPAAADGRVIFASDDGHLYAVAAHSGDRLWTVQAAPADHRVLGNERIISMWPVRGGPVILDETVYAAAGIWPFMGIFLYALEAATGRLLWANEDEGTRWQAQPHGGADAFAGIAPQGYLAAAGDRLAVSGGRSTPALFDRQTGHLIHVNLRAKAAGWDRPAGGYRVKTDGRFLYNHGQRYDLQTGADAGRHWIDVLDGETAYRGSDGMLTAMAVASTGELETLWETPVPGLRALHLKAGNQLVADADGGRILLIEAPAEIDREPDTRRAAKAPSPTIKALDTRLDGPVTAMLAADGYLVAVTERGTFYAFGAEKRNPAHHLYAPPPIQPTATGWTEALDQLISDQPGLRSGYALVIGGGADDLVDALLTRTDLHIVVAEPDPGIVARLRARLVDAGLYQPRHDVRTGVYGTRIAVLEGAIETVPLPPTVFNLVVADSADRLAGDTDSSHRLHRVVQRLRPYGGTALLPIDPDQATAVMAGLNSFDLGKVVATAWHGMLRVTREGPLPGAGQWTHQYADSANTVMSHDVRVRAPLGILWFGGPSHDNILPRHAAGPRPQVSGGRLTILGVETLSARDVYTGRELWVRNFPGIGHPFTNLELEARWREGEAVYMPNQPGAAYIGSPYVSLADAIYVRYRHAVHRLDPETGRTQAVFPLPGTLAPQTPDWGHISVWNDDLITTINPHIFEDGRLGELNWDASSSETVVIMNRFSGEILWTRDARIGFRHHAIVSAAGTLYLIDGVSEQARGFLERRGRLPDVHSTIMALDLATGEPRWTNDSDIFGTFLTYSETHDVLIEGGTRDSRRHLTDEPHGRMAARRGRDGERIWEREDSFDGPVIIRGETIIPARPGIFRNLLTGEDETRIDPLTGEETPRAYHKTYGCGTANASHHLLLFRSGSAGFLDIDQESATSTLGGFKSGCTASMIVADGVLSAPDYTRTCTCSYQNQTSVGLIHMPEMEMLTFLATVPDPEPGTLQRVGVNFGAPGPRLDAGGTLWLEHPPTAVPSPSVSIEVDPASHLTTFRHHPLRFDGDPDPLRWISASGIEGARRIRIAGLHLPDDPATYSVHLYFAEPGDAGERDRVFDVWIQGQRAAAAIDPVRQTTEPHATLRFEARGVRPTAVVSENGDRHGRLDIELDPASGALYEPIICGLEIIIEE